MGVKIKPHEILVAGFLAAGEVNAGSKPVRVLKSTTYKIGKANVLVRAAAENNRRYFFGINYLTVEDMANLENPFIAFICGMVERTVIVPASELFANLSEISHDRNGEYKINIDRDLNIVLAGRGNRMDCQSFINGWKLLTNPPKTNPKESMTVEESLHSVLQGRLIEIGNIRGFRTFCPDKQKVFNNKKLAEISTLEKCPDLQFSKYDFLCRIDVIWFKRRGDNYLPKYAFEVELSTGVWSGVGRMATLMDYSDVNLYIIANDAKKYNKVINVFPEYKHRYKYLSNKVVSELYAAEIELISMRQEIGL